MNNSFEGMGMSPRPTWKHQSLIERLHGRTYRELSQQGLRMFMETTPTENLNDRVPDLVVFDRFMIPLVFIEITTHCEVKKNLQKCVELMERFEDAESFVYDYEKEELIAFDFEQRKWITSNDYELYSAYLKEPVINYLLP